MKIHYTIFDYYRNIRGQYVPLRTPICNLSVRYDIAYITRNIEEVTCKNCMKGMISIKKEGLKMDYLSSEDREKKKQEVEYLQRKLNQEHKGE